MGSYKEPQQFRHHTQTTTPLSESRSAKKRRLREELKASRKAYLSLPSTPKNRHDDEFDSQIVTPRSTFSKNRTNSLLQGTKIALEDTKKQRRKDKKLNKKMKNSLPVEFDSFLSENLEETLESRK